VPNSEVARNAINGHFFVRQTVVPELLEVFVDGLFNNSFAFVAP